MRVCAVSFKECWQDNGRWMSSGGFPMQMSAIASLFDEMTLVIVEGTKRSGGIPLPACAAIVPLSSPRGSDLRRKLSVAARLPYYVGVIAREAARADVVHAPVPGDIPFLSVLVANVLRKPLIARYGSSWEATTETTVMNRLTKSMMRRLAGGANVMLATGAGAGAPARNVHWLFATAISRAEVDAVRPMLDRRPHRPLRLAYAGRLSPEKGVRYLVAAMARLRDRGHGDAAQLTLIGDGPERAELESLIERLDCGQIVTFAGQLERRALLDTLQQMDVCVLPSLTESFCKARLDAMLCGVPIVTTAVGFGRDIAGSDGERGWIVAAANVPALAETLMKIATEPRDWPALRRRCRGYVESRTLEAWAARIADICSAQWKLQIVDGKLRA
jgi:glycosyltransferase involved in cell wall biosynthesis